MTGFGRGSRGPAAVGVRTLNHKGRDIAVRLPPMGQACEPFIRHGVEKVIHRGRVEVTVSFSGLVPSIRFVPNLAAAKAYAAALRRLAHEVGTDDSGVAGKRQWQMVDIVASRPDVIHSYEIPPREARLKEWILPALSQALRACVMMRSREGEHLWRDMSKRITRIQRIIRKMEARLPRELSAARDRLKVSIRDLVEKGQMDEGRLEQEIVARVERAGVTEELVRLSSHLVQLGGCVRQASPVGRTVDFVVQEMQREVHTIGAKTPGPWIGRQIVSLRELLEQLREQAQNVE